MRPPSLDLNAILDNLPADNRQHNFVFSRRQRNRRSRDDLPSLLTIRRNHMRRILSPRPILAKHIELKIPSLRSMRGRNDREQSSNGKQSKEFHFLSPLPVRERIKVRVRLQRAISRAIQDSALPSTRVKVTQSSL